VLGNTTQTGYICEKEVVIVGMSSDDGVWTHSGRRIVTWDKEIYPKDWKVD